MREIRFEVEGESVAASLHEPPATPLGHLVLVHGFLSQRREYGPAPDALAARGWRVLAVDQRGFGASGGPRGKVSLPRATADTMGAIAWAEKDRPGLPLGLVGHSMGAAPVLDALAQGAPARAAVLAAPMRTFRAELHPLEFQGYLAAARVSKLKERLGLGSLKVPYKYDYARLFDDPDAVARARREAFLTPTVDLANTEDMLAIDTVPLARRVRAPVRVLLAERDRAVKNANSLQVLDALAGPKDLQRLPCGHSVFGDREAARAIELVDEWMRRHLLASG